MNPATKMGAAGTGETYAHSPLQVPSWQVRVHWSGNMVFPSRTHLCGCEVQVTALSGLIAGRSRLVCTTSASFFTRQATFSLQIWLYLLKNLKKVESSRNLISLPSPSFLFLSNVKVS